MTDPTSSRQLIRPLIVGIVLVSLFAFFFVYPGHDPQPHGVPVAVVGDGGPLEQRLEGRGFDVRSVETLDDARDAILDREVYGAISIQDGAVLVSSAASLPVSEIIRGATDAVPVDVDVEDVRALDDDDPRGVSINLVVLATTVPSILGAMLVVTLAPAVTGWRRLGAIGTLAVVGGLVSTLVVHTAIGSIPGAFLGIWGVTSLTILAIGATAAALVQLLGPAGIGVSFLLLLVLGNPASGAFGGRFLLQEPWRTGGQFLPPGAFATGLRNVAYFDGVQALAWGGVLVAWAAFGSAIVLGVGRRSVPGGARASR